MNVVIYRLKTRQKLCFSGSLCPECKIRLKWYDLMPLLSFIFLKGHCRYCGKKISWQYPLVEFLSGLIWISIAYKSNFQFSINFQSIFNFQFFNFIYYIFIFSVLLVIAVYDFKWRIIPDKIVYLAIVIALIYNLFNALSLFTASVAFLFFFLIFYFSSGRAMGLGDAKLAFLIGLFLNPLLAIAAFMSAFIIGAVFGIILIGFGKKTLKSQIAFGPFLILGASIVFFFSSFFVKLFNF